MIAWIMETLGFYGMVALALAATLVGGTVYTKLAISSRDKKIAEKNQQLQTVAFERDRLKVANADYTRVVSAQNTQIENLLAQADYQKIRTARAVKEAEKTKAEYQAFIDHLNSSSATGGDRWELYGDTFTKAVKKWTTKDIDSAPSEMP